MTTVHVYPMKDSINHATDGSECACNPIIEPVMREDGSNGWLVRHNVRKVVPPVGTVV